MNGLTNTDVISLVAIIATTCVSIVTLLVGLYTNLINNKAKRREIAFERQIEALREVVEKVSFVKVSVTYILKSVHQEDVVQAREMLELTRRNLDDFLDAIGKQRIFMPPKIYNAVTACYEKHDIYIDMELNIQNVAEWEQYAVDIEYDLMLMTHRYIGIK